MRLWSRGVHAHGHTERAKLNVAEEHMHDDCLLFFFSIWKIILVAWSSHASCMRAQACKVNTHLNLKGSLWIRIYISMKPWKASGGLLVHQRRPCLVRQNIYELHTDGLQVNFVPTPSSHCLKQMTGLSASTFCIPKEGHTLNRS